MIKRFLGIALAVCSLASAAHIEQFVDPRDQQTYPVVRIGSESYFAKNLNYNLKGSSCYDDNPENCKKYGRLYTWEQAQGICPMGWEIFSEDDIKDIEKDKQALSIFNIVPAGFKNAKGKYELLDKRLDMWLTAEVDKKNAKYWYYSASANSTGINQYSKKGAMSVRCVNYVEPGYCDYDCTCDRGMDYPIAKEFENDKILVCTYVFEQRTGVTSPFCPRDYTHYTRYWKKTNPDTIPECPEPYGDSIESFEGKVLFKNYNSEKEPVINEKGLCTIKTNYDEIEYKNCIPKEKAASELTPLGRQLFGI